MKVQVLCGILCVLLGRELISQGAEAILAGTLHVLLDAPSQTLDPLLFEVRCLEWLQSSSSWEVAVLNG